MSATKLSSFVYPSIIDFPMGITFCQHVVQTYMLCALLSLLSVILHLISISLHKLVLDVRLPVLMQFCIF